METECEEGRLKEDIYRLFADTVHFIKRLEKQLISDLGILESNPVWIPRMTNMLHSAPQYGHGSTISQLIALVAWLSKKKKKKKVLSGF